MVVKYQVWMLKCFMLYCYCNFHFCTDKLYHSTFLIFFIICRVNRLTHLARQVMFLLKKVDLRDSAGWVWVNRTT